MRRFSTWSVDKKRGRTQEDVAETCEPAVLEQRLDKRCRGADDHLNFLTNEEILKHHAQRRDKGGQLFRNTPSSLWDGAIDVVPSAKAADECAGPGGGKCT